MTFIELTEGSTIEASSVIVNAEHILLMCTSEFENLTVVQLTNKKILYVTETTEQILNKIGG